MALHACANRHPFVYEPSKLRCTSCSGYFQASHYKSSNCLISQRLKEDIWTSQISWSLHCRAGNFFRQLLGSCHGAISEGKAIRAPAVAYSCGKISLKGYRCERAKNGFEQFCFLLSVDEVDILLEAGKEFRVTSTYRCSKMNVVSNDILDSEENCTTSAFLHNLKCWHRCLVCGLV